MITSRAFHIRRVAHVVFLSSLSVAPAALAAQRAPPPSVGNGAPGTAAHEQPIGLTGADSVVAIGPRAQPVGLRMSTVARTAENAAESPAPLPRPRAGKAVAMMGVGVAALIAGSLVGGDSGAVIAVAGAAVGLTGLYVYLR